MAEDNDAFHYPNQHELSSQRIPTVRLLQGKGGVLRAAGKGKERPEQKED